MLHVLFQFHTIYVLLRMSKSKFKMSGMSTIDYIIFKHSPNTRNVEQKEKKDLKSVTLQHFLLSIIGD